MKKLNIEMVHDITCSWCPIGYANLKQALKNLKVEADIRFLPFELNPNLTDEGEEIGSYFARRHQWDDAKLQSYRANLLEVAEEAGVEIDFSKRTHYLNTRKAHRLIHWSEGYGKQTQANELLINAYFKLGLDINDTEVLVNIAARLDQNPELARQAITSEKTDSEMAKKHERVKKLGVAGIPVFIFEGREIVKGSNSVTYFEEVISDNSYTLIPKSYKYRGL